MKKPLSGFLAILMVLPLITVFFTLGASAAAVYDSINKSDTGITFGHETFTKAADQSYTEAAVSFHYGVEMYVSKKRLAEMPHTFQAWVKVSDTDKGVIVGNYRVQNDTAGAYLNIEIKSGRIPYVKHYDEFGSLHEISFTKGTIPSNAWTLLTIIWDGENGHVSCYVNGEMKQDEYFLPDIDPHVLEYPFAIGGDHRVANTNYFTGALQDVSLYSCARTAQQVASDYSNGVNVNDEGLLCHYNISSATKGKDLVDATGNGYNMIYDKTWLTESEMVDIRKKNGVIDAGGNALYDYSFAVIGDPQKTTRYEAVTRNNRDPSITVTDKQYVKSTLTYKMYNWLVTQKDAKNISLVMGVGDITDYNFGREWQLAHQSITQLDGKIPYTLVRGNHDDFDDNSNQSSSTHFYFDHFFGKTTQSDYSTQFGSYKEYKNSQDQVYVSTEGGRYLSNSVRNTYLKVTTANGDKWLILALDWNCDDNVLNWAGNVCAANSAYSVIITTHAYLGSDGSPLRHGQLSDTPNNGDDKWNKLASQYANVKMVLSGHIGTDMLPTTQVKGVNGNTVTQMLVCGQDADETLHGLGLVTMLYFNEDGSECFVEYYSVALDRYFHTANQFLLDLDTEDAEEQDLTGSDIVEGEKPSGRGTAANPYLISDVKHLAWMAYQVEKNNNTVYFDGVYFEQTCDIDMGGKSIQAIGGYFNTTSAARAFGGYYNGKGYSIKNGGIVPTETDNSMNKRKHYGLFGCIYGATIKNVVLEDMQIFGRGPTGAIVGKAMAPWDGSADVGFNKIIGCHVGEGVEIRTWHPSPVNTNTIDDTNRGGVVGGICGIAYATTIQGCTVDSSIAVSGTFGIVGGIAGTAGYNTVIDHCAFTGGLELVDTRNYGSLAFGGIVGMISPNVDTSVDDTFYTPMAGILHITNCYSSGSYEYTGTKALTYVADGYNVNNQSFYWGGIVGYTGKLLVVAATDEVPYPYLIENCHNLYGMTRNTQETSTDKFIAGGLVGGVNTANNGSFLRVDNSYSVEVADGGLSNGTNEYRMNTYSGVMPLQTGSAVGTREAENMPTHAIKRHSAKAPTCTELGWDTYTTCKRSGCTYTTYTERSALTHDIEHHSAKAPTCTELGWDAYTTCKRSDCTYTTYTEKSVLGHKDGDKDGKCDSCAKQLSAALYDDKATDTNNESDGLSGGAVAGIAVGAVVVVGFGGFSLFWFVIKKKRFSDLFRKK